MRTPSFLLFLFLGYGFANAQTNLDSLYGVWEDKTQADSSRILAFTDYIWDGYMNSNPDSTLILADQLFEFSVKKANKDAAFRAMNIKGLAYNMKNEFALSLLSYKKGLKISEELGDKELVSVIFCNIGNAYADQGNNIAAIEYYIKSLRIDEEMGNQIGISGNLNNIGIIYSELGDNTKAMDYLTRSLKIDEELGDRLGVSISLNYIGLVHEAMGDHEKALESYLRSLNLKIDEELGDRVGISSVLTNISKYYFNRGDNSKAMDYIKRSLTIDQEMGDKAAQAECLNFIGQIYLKQGDVYKALDYCNKGLNFALETGIIVSEKESCDCLFKVYKAMGNGNKALFYLERSLVLTDSMQMEETGKKLQQMEFSKQVLTDSLLQVEKDIKVEMAHQTEVRTKDRNRNIAIGAGIFLLFLSAGLFSRWRYVKKSKAVIEKEKDRSNNLLLNILPAEIAEELKIKGKADARDFDLASILFTDFKSFTETSAKLTAKELIGEINHCFEAFDHICEKFRIEKIKTIGDAYMAAGGLPVPSDDSVKNTVLAALAMQSFISERIKEKRTKNEIPFEMRLGIHTGPVVAGIVGVKKFQYDIWGDTVNTASRLESNGEIGQVNISHDTYILIKDDPQFRFEARGKIEAKGKGELEMYFVSKAE